MRDLQLVGFKRLLARANLRLARDEPLALGAAMLGVAMFFLPILWGRGFGGDFDIRTMFVNAALDTLEGDRGSPRFE